MTEERKKPGRKRAGTISTGMRDVEMVRVDPDAIKDENLFDHASIDVHASVPLQDLLQTIGADSPDGSVTVSRINIKPGGARVEEYLFAGQPSGDLLNDLQADYGPGTYNVKVYARDADGVKACRANKTVTIGPLPASKLKTIEATPAPPREDRLADVLAEIAKSNAQREAQLFSLVQAVITGGGNSAEKQLSGLKTLAESIGIVGKVAPAGPGPLDMLAMLQSMMKMAKDFSPGSESPALPLDGDIGPNALLAQGMQMFAKILELAKGQQAQPPAIAGAPVQHISELPQASAAPPVAHRPGNGAPPASQSENSPEDDEAMMMRLFIKRLVNAARKNEPVDGYAEQLEPLVNDEAVAVIRSPQWFAALCGIYPDASAHQAWFARLREALIVLMDEADGVDGGDPAINAEPAAKPPTIVN